MAKLGYWFKLCRNVFVAILSVAWVLPFSGFIRFSLRFLKLQEAELKIFEEYYPNGPPFSNIKVSQGFLSLATYLLMIAIGFWSFVLSNKLWPIKGKKTEELSP